MVKRHVRVYVEGGAEGRVEDQDFRRGWKKFLNDLHLLARANGFQSLEIVRGKGRARTFASFVDHQRRFPHDLGVLLVDSESAVKDGQSVWGVVSQRKGDGWKRPDWATPRHLFLMVQFVETWLLTDQEALAQYFRAGFDASGLPTTNLEARSKDDIGRALKRATQSSRKGEYRHGQAHEILEFINPERVKTLTHGKRLFDVLGQLIAPNETS